MADPIDANVSGVHFSAEEMHKRRQRAAQAITDARLDGLLCFKQESMYYLTGYDTFGFSMFQCMVFDDQAQASLLTRNPDLRQALYTSDLDADQIQIWDDVEGMDPALDLRNHLAERGLRNKRLGIEFDSYGLKASNWRLLEAALDGFCELVDASKLIDELRSVKSSRELQYIRRAAELADDGLDEAVALARPGSFEGDILAAMQGAVFKGGGDYAGNEFIIGSGPSALLVRYHAGKRHLAAQDQLTLEWAGAYFRYHAAMMRTILLGNRPQRQLDMYERCRDALLGCEAAVRPGKTMGEVFDEYARVMDQAGLSDCRFTACGYGMGAVFNPLWVDPPMFYAGNPQIIQADEVYFLHMIVVDSANELAMTLGHSVRVTETQCERLSRASMDLLHIQ